MADNLKRARTFGRIPNRLLDVLHRTMGRRRRQTFNGGRRPAWRRSEQIRALDKLHHQLGIRRRSLGARIRDISCSEKSQKNAQNLPRDSAPHAIQTPSQKHNHYHLMSYNRIIHIPASARPNNFARSAMLPARTINTVHENSRTRSAAPMGNSRQTHRRRLDSTRNTNRKHQNRPTQTWT